MRFFFINFKKKKKKIFEMRKFCFISIYFWYFYIISLLFITFLNFLIYNLFKSNQIIQKCERCSDQNQIKFENVEEITFVSVPRPFMKKDVYNRNKLAISSWLSCSNKSKVLLFVNRSDFDPTGEFPNEIDELYGKNRVIYAGPIRSNINNIPYIDEWFKKGIDLSESKYICFINGDIVLSSKWLLRVKQVFQVMKNKSIVMIGQRIDFTLNQGDFQNLRFNSSNLLEEIDNMVENSIHSDHSPYGVDTFTFRIDKLPFNVNLIPPFIMGRYNWDNWLVGYLNSVCETITFNTNPPIYHVDHQRHNFDISDYLVSINHYLRKANKNFFGSNYDTKWEIIDNKLIKRGLGISIELSD